MQLIICMLLNKPYISIMARVQWHITTHTGHSWPHGLTQDTVGHTVSHRTQLATRSHTGHGWPHGRYHTGHGWPHGLTQDTVGHTVSHRTRLATRFPTVCSVIHRLTGTSTGLQPCLRDKLVRVRLE